MKMRTIAVKSMVAIMICSSAVVRPAAAFIWPTLDMTQVGSLISDISNGVSQISNTKSQIDNAVQTIHTVGDQATSITKYTADLKGKFAKIGNLDLQSLTITEDVESSLVKIKNSARKSDEDTEQTTSSTVENVNSQVDDEAEEDDVQSTIQDAEDEIEEQVKDLNESYNQAADEITKIADKVIEQLKIVAPALEQATELTPETRKLYQTEVENLIISAENLKKDILEAVKNAQAKLDSEYKALLNTNFSAYKQAVSDYYDGKISKAELEAAGNQLQQKISSLQTGLADEQINKLVHQAQEFTVSAQKLHEDILNALGNSREYSDEDTPPDKLSQNLETGKKYFFQHSSVGASVYAKQIYFNKDIDPKLSEEYQIFGLSKELLCHKLTKDNLKELEKYTDAFRECVTLAKAEKEYICTIKGIPLTDKDCDPYVLEPHKLYKKFRRNGVYDHIVEDYSVANIVNNNRIQQFTATWFEKIYGDMLKIITPDGDSSGETTGETTIDNSRNAYVAMEIVDLEAPKLWSWVRVTDTLQRSKDSVQQFNTGSTLYLDGRDDDFKNASQRKNGLMKNIKITGIDGRPKPDEDRQVFSNVFLYNCNIKADDISTSVEDKYNASIVEEKEKNIAKCLYKHAAGASGRRPDAGDPTSTFCGNSLTLEQCKTIWKNKEIKAINDSSFQTLTLATINNYKSSRDYINPNNLEHDEINIASLQKDMEKNTAVRDDLSSGAQINYYSTMQILSIVDADAQNLQTEILKYLTALDYNFFDESFNGEAQE